ncbi:MAG: hypothetical protein PCFJNLEI_00903 [Verrucomicrobiae bacterium]|nr:hypothetical protein [Verrucomicrobiae bacterium]
MSRLEVMLTFLLVVPVFAQLEIVPDDQPQTVFAGKPQTVRLVIHNKGDKQFDADVTTRLFQTTAATAAPVGDAQPWKTVHVLPGQTVIETATFKFPAVRAATRFLVQWDELGRTPVVVYPDDLLKGLSKLAGDNPVAVFDPENKLKPVLKQAGVKYADFEIETEDCRLALVWSARLPENVSLRMKNGMGAVWIRSTKSPVAFAVRRDAGILVTVPPSVLTALTDSPQSQANLLRFAELALQLPDINQP